MLVDGPVRLLAGPGTGKTHSLVQLYAELVESGTARRGEILVLTFSKSAAEEVANRLDERLRDSYDEAWISTFHSFCLRLLRDAPARRDVLLMSGFQEWLVMRRALGEMPVDELGALAAVRSSDRFAQDVLGFVSLMKQNLVDAASFELLAGGSGSERVRALAAVYRRYEDRLRASGLQDFRDLVSRTIELLGSDPPLLARLRGRFRYVLVDEFQDVDPAQFEVLRLLAPPDAGPRLVVAGDPNQSIYGFRGTVPALLTEEFPAAYRCRTVALEQSRRCAPEIMEAAQRLLRETQPGELHLQRPTVDGARSVVVVEEANAVEEAFYTAREVKRLLVDEAIAPSQIAILLRSSMSLSAPFEEALRALAIPYELRGLSAMSRNEVVRFLLSYLRSLLQPDDSSALARLLGSSLSGVGPHIVGRLQARAGEEGRPLLKVVRQLMYRLAEFDGRRFPLPWEPGAAVEADPKHEWPADLLDVESAEKLHRALSAWYLLRRRARALPISALAYSVLVESRLLERLLALPLDGEDRLEALADLRAATDAFDAVDEVLTRLDGTRPVLADLELILDRLVVRAVDESEPAPRSRDAVQVLTVHQAKGLEFEAVFVSGFAAGIFPVRAKPNPILEPEDQRWLAESVHGFRPSWPLDADGHLAEEGRLAYVAMTRARRKLYLTYAREYERPAGPSPFLEPLTELFPAAGASAELKGIEETVLTRTDAETLLAFQRDSLNEAQLERTRRLGLDGAFITDPASGTGFLPYDERPSGVDPHHFSATDLTAYLKCPRLYWYTHHPGLAPPDRSAEMERGGFIHRVLEDFHRRESEWRHLPADSARAWLENAISTHLEDYLSRIDQVLDRRREEQEVRRILRNYAEFATSFQKVRRLGTISTEKRFLLHLDIGSDLDREAERVSAEIHGKIDRINDTGDGTCEVVDYKTGNAHSPNRDYQAYFGDDMYDVQLAIYHLACLQGVDEEGNPLALNPRFLSLWYPKERRFDAAIRQVLFSVGEPAGLNQWWERKLEGSDLERARNRVLGAIRGILGGDFQPRPLDGVVGTCLSFSGCAHEAICPFARARLE